MVSVGFCVWPLRSGLVAREKMALTSLALSIKKNSIAPRKRSGKSCRGNCTETNLKQDQPNLPTSHVPFILF